MNVPETADETGVCIVVPCFNEGRRLPVDAFVAALPRHCAFCFVDDGSSDDTAAVLARLQSTAPGQIKIVTLAKNSGKAEAVRQGVMQSLAWRRFEFVGYWDADLAAPLTEIPVVLDAMRRQPHCELALGSRVKRLGAHIERRAIRHVVGRMFATLASVLLDMAVYDSQCGAKLIRAATAARLFAEPFVTRWLFDLELLARLRRHGRRGLESAIEIPLGEWRDVRGSKLPIASMVIAPLDLLRVRRHYRLQR